MVKVVFGRSSEKLVEFKASGHAGAANEGYDLICSGISASTIMIANGITDVLKVPCEVSLMDGFLHINLKKLTMDQIDNCQVLMETLLLGLKAMEQNYGEYIKVLVEEV